MKRLERDTKEHGKKEQICGTGVKKLGRLQDYIKRDKAI